MAINVNINVSNLGAAVLSQTNPAAQSWIRVETNGAITLRTAAETLSDLGAQAAGAYVTAVTASGNIASSGGTTPNITFTGVLPTANGGTAVNIATTALTLGTASSAAGSIILQNATNANTVTINSGVTSASYALTFPTAQGGANTYLKNDGAGALSWATVASGISIGDTIGNSPVTGSALMAIGGVITQSISYRAQQATPFSTAFGFESHSSGSFSGVGNTSFGYQAGKAITTATRNTFIGYRAGASATTTLINDNVCIGYGAGSALDPSADCSRNVMIGSNAGERYWWKDAVFIGYNRGKNSGVQGNYNILIGSAPNNGSTYSDGVYASTIAIGYDCFNTATHQGILGSNNANGYISNWYFNGVTHTAPYSTALRASGGSGTNINGANMTLSGGAATGTGNGGYVKATTSVKRASGTTVQSDTDRNVIVGKYVDITESAATTYGTLALTTSGTIAGGTIIYTIEANDGTDYQSLTGNAVYSVVNKAGTLTVTLTDLTQALAESAGGSTLTSTMTATVSGTSVLFQANAVSSLVQTTLRISFQVLNNFGVAIISPA